METSIDTNDTSHFLDESDDVDIDIDLASHQSGDDTYDSFAEDYNTENGQYSAYQNEVQIEREEMVEDEDLLSTVAKFSTPNGESFQDIGSPVLENETGSEDVIPSIPDVGDDLSLADDRLSHHDLELINSDGNPHSTLTSPDTLEIRAERLVDVPVNKPANESCTKTSDSLVIETETSELSISRDEPRLTPFKSDPDAENVNTEYQESISTVSSIQDLWESTFDPATVESEELVQEIVKDRKFNSAQEVQYESLVFVVYRGAEMLLFPPKSQDEELSQTYLLQDESLANQDITNLLSACRLVLADSIEEDDELLFVIDDLGLCVSDTSAESTSVNLMQLLDLWIRMQEQDGIDKPSPLCLTLITKTKFSRRLAYLLDLAASGKGLSQLYASQGTKDTNEDLGDQIPKSDILHENFNKDQFREASQNGFSQKMGEKDFTDWHGHHNQQLPSDLSHPLIQKITQQAAHTQIRENVIEVSEVRDNARVSRDSYNQIFSSPLETISIPEVPLKVEDSLIDINTMIHKSVSTCSSSTSELTTTDELGKLKKDIPGIPIGSRALLDKQRDVNAKCMKNNKVDGSVSDPGSYCDSRRRYTNPQSPFQTTNTSHKSLLSHDELTAVVYLPNPRKRKDRTPEANTEANMNWDESQEHQTKKRSLSEIHSQPALHENKHGSEDLADMERKPESSKFRSLDLSTDTKHVQGSLEVNEMNAQGNQLCEDADPGGDSAFHLADHGSPTNLGHSNDVEFNEEKDVSTRPNEIRVVKTVPVLDERELPASRRLIDDIDADEITYEDEDNFVEPPVAPTLVPDLRSSSPGPKQTQIYPENDSIAVEDFSSELYS